MQKWNIGSLNQGKQLSPKTKQKISLKLKEGYSNGRKVWNEGKDLSLEIKTKISKSKKGSIPWNKGVQRTEAEKQKMRMAAKKMWERRKKLDIKMTT